MSWANSWVSTYKLVTEKPWAEGRAGTTKTQQKVLPNRKRGKPGQSSMSLKTRKGAMMPPRSLKEEHTITPRFLGRNRE